MLIAHIRWPQRISVCSALLLCLASARGLIAEDWAMYQHDAAHTGFANVSLDPRQLTLAWTSPVGFDGPIIHDNSVYAFGDKVVASFDLATGHPLWSRPIVLPGSLAYGGGMLVTTTYAFGTSKALAVLDPSSGALRYTVPFGSNKDFPGIPMLYQKANQWNALIMDAGGSLFSIRLGQSSGSVNWTTPVGYVGGEAPTVAGNSAIIASFGAADAIDLDTGTRSRFFSQSSLSSAGGFGVAYDAARQQLYFSNALSVQQPSVLLAYHYQDNAHITQLWSRPGESGYDPALGPNGEVYLTSSTSLFQIDPSTGSTIRSLPGQSFAAGSTPEIFNGYLLDYSSFQQVFYDLTNLSVAATLPGSLGNMSTEIRSVDAISDSAVALQNTRFGTGGTFSVYAVPEPNSGLVVACCLAMKSLLRRRAQKSLALLLP